MLLNQLYHTNLICSIFLYKYMNKYVRIYTQRRDNMFEKWYESSKTLLNLYKKLALLRIDGKENTDEFNLILSLLESSIKFEKDKIEKIDFNDETLCELYEMILKAINVDNPLTVMEMLSNNNALIYARMYNIAEAIDYNPNNLRADDMPKDTLVELIASLYIEQDEKDSRFSHYFQSYVGFNIIYIINLAIESTKDNKVREFLIKLLYSSIYVNPIYEEYFKKSMVVSKPINISIYLFELISNSYSKEEIMDDIMYNLVDFTIDEIEMELNKKDTDLIDETNHFEYIKNLTSIMGKLISLMDTSVVDQVETKIKEIIDNKGRSDNLRIVNEVMYMLSKSRSIIAKYNKERELKYGKTTEETN